MHPRVLRRKEPLVTSVHSLASKLLAEFVGTFFLVAVGIAVILNGGDLLAVAFAHGLVIAIGVTAVGHVSGGHFNPAVSATMVALRQQPLVDGIAYIVTQLVAGVVAALAVIYTFDISDDKLAAATPQLAHVSAGQGFVLEAIATFLLGWTIFAVAVDRDGAFFKVAGMPIGFAITCGILLAGPHTGAALNPARWFGPAIVSGTWDDAWVWVAGPLVGLLVAGFAYMYGIKPRLAGPAAAPDTV
jgi:aquaporin Z